MTGRAHLRRRLGAAALFGLTAALVIPALAAAHPLGNFTINHYAGIRVEPDRVLLDVVIDEAEIPAFQARLDFDTDGDGEVSDAETDAGRGPACDKLAPSLALSVDGTAQALTVVEAGLTFPPGVGGLSTMRMVCEYATSLAAPVSATTTIDYKDSSFPDRLGWREIVVSASGVTLTAAKGAELRTATTSARLTAYPTTLLTQALADASVALTASPGGPTLPPLAVPDASPLPGAVGVATATDPPPPGGTTVSAPVVTTVAPGAPAAAAGTVPGGVSSGDLPSIFRSADLSPWVLLVSILTAAALGAGHALTPGHGKTLMAAYLVGTKGTPLHAAGLGLSVTLSHTIGILVLAGLVVGAQGFLPPDVIVRSAPVIAAVSIVAIGGWMLFGEGRRRWRLRVAAGAHAAAHEHGEAHEHAHDHDHDHDAGGTRRAQPRWRQPQPPPADGRDHHVAQPVRPRPCRRVDPVGQRPADPARVDRRGTAGVRLRPRRRLRARDGPGHERDRARARARPRPPRSRRDLVAARSVQHLPAARGLVPRVRARAVPDLPGGRRRHHLLGRRSVAAR